MRVTSGTRQSRRQARRLTVARRIDQLRYRPLLKPDVLLMGPLIADTMARLEAGYTVHRYDTAADGNALVGMLAPHLKAIATRGDYRLPGALMRRLPKLRVIASSGTGYDGIDVATARELGVAVTHSPAVAAECVADAAWALILATVRRTVAQDRFVRAGEWLHASAPLTDKVWGEKLGIVGLGSIGRAVARRGEAFRMDIAYYSRRQHVDVSYRYVDDLTRLACEVKLLLVAVPGGSATRGLISRDVIDALGPEGYLFNVSRGSTVDEAYLVDALVHGRLAGAGLDVFADEPRVPPALFELDRVVLQPHAASGTRQTRNALGQSVIDNLAAYFAGRPLVSPIPDAVG